MKKYRLAEQTRVDGKLYGAGSNRIHGIKTGEYRPPLRSEYFLSGAIPGIYKAPNNLSYAYHIIKLIKKENLL